MKNQKHLRAESECKEKVTSIRLTQGQHERVKKKAHEKGMTISNYIITTAVNGNSVTPELLVKLQDIANEACSVMEKYEPDRIAAMQQEVNRIWQKLM